MTRKDYIGHLDALRKGVLKIIDFDRNERQNNGGLAGPTSHEDERGKKTQKMFDDLVTRLYEDAAISEKIMQEKILAGDLEQAARRLLLFLGRHLVLLSSNSSTRRSRR